MANHTNKITTEFNIEMLIPEKPYAYISEFGEEYKDFIQDFDYVLMYAKKGKGKSEVGYRGSKEIIEELKGLVIYGRLQLEEKKTAYAQLTQGYQAHNMKPQKLKGYGNDYIGFYDLPLLRLVNISSYQKNRGAVAEGKRIKVLDLKKHEYEVLDFDSHEGYVLTPQLIGFDEINATSGKEGFNATFLLTLDTLGRNHRYKFLGTGNNETAVNNPVLNALQLKFNGEYEGLQLVYRIVKGVKVLGIQLGRLCFDEDKNPPTMTERLAENNETIYNQYFVGKQNLNSLESIINLKEDYKLIKPLLYYAHKEHVYCLWQADIDDNVNNIHVKNGYIFKEVETTFSQVYKNKKLPFYTSDKETDAYYKEVKGLDLIETMDLAAPGAQAIKERKMFYASFDAQEILKNVVKMAQQYTEKWSI